MCNNLFPACGHQVSPSLRLTGGTWVPVSWLHRPPSAAHLGHKYNVTRSHQINHRSAVRAAQWVSEWVGQRPPLESYYCVSPILVIAFELQQRHTSLICIYLLPITSFFFYLIPASLKSSLLPHSYTNTTSEDDPVQYSRSVKPDFWLYYSNKVLHSILRQQNSMWQNKRILSCIFNSKDL